MPPIKDVTNSNIPQFLIKLWKMTNDPGTDDLIRWGPPEPNGRRLIIRDDVKLNLLPTYYKHNNISSFIRQLNMYGFHRVSTEVDEVQFFHKFFQKEHPLLIEQIKRKNQLPKASEASAEEYIDQIGKALSDIQVLQEHQESVDNQLDELRQENATLWRELAIFRKKFSKQQKIIDKLINFLETIVHPSHRGLGGLGAKRRYPLMIDNSKRKPKVNSNSDDTTNCNLHLETEPNNDAGSDTVKNSKNENVVEYPPQVPKIKTEPDIDPLNMECSETITPTSQVDPAGFSLRDVNLIHKILPGNLLEEITTPDPDKQVDKSRAEISPIDTQVAKQETMDPLFEDVKLPHIINPNIKVTETLFKSEPHSNDFEMITDDMGQPNAVSATHCPSQSIPSVRVGQSRLNQTLQTDDITKNSGSFYEEQTFQL